jgi:hypothetical protein
MRLYKISRWGELYENSRSRTLGNLTWVIVPNRHDGEHYTSIITHKDGAEVFSAWNLILQVASKCNPRGILIKDNGNPHDSTSLSTKTRAPKSWFDKAFSFLEENTDWLEWVEFKAGNSIPDSFLTGSYRPTCHPPVTEGKGREGKEGKGREDMLPKEVAFWNANCGELPKVAAMSDERWKHLRARRQDLFWVANFEQAVLRVLKSDFCNGKIPPTNGHRVFKADIDWMLQSNVVAKIVEGKYDNRNTSSSRNLDLWPGDTRFSLTIPPPASSSVGILEAYGIWKTKRLKQKSESK